MPNCRSIPADAWEHAREALIFFFSRRHGLADAEDLAQEALVTLWSREDYEFEREEDFLRVCYGFARLVSLKGYRDTRKHAGEELDVATTAAPRDSGGLIDAETRILLDQVYKVAGSKLPEKDWQLIQQAAVSDRAAIGDALNMGDANNVRVRLHRARKKLARLTGWGRKGV